MWSARAVYGMDTSYHEADPSLIWRGHNGGEYLESLAGVVAAATVLVVAAAVRVGCNNLKPRLTTSSRLMYAVRVVSAHYRGPSRTIALEVSRKCASRTE
jgi:hypothetical protein